MHFETPSFTFALALGVGVMAHLVARHLRIPSIVILLAAGVGLGPDGLGWILPRTLGDGLTAFVSLGVAVILFEGGLGLDLHELRTSAVPVRRLVTSGALITALGAGLAAHLFMNWPLDLALLYGTLVIVTGPTVIRPLLRLVPLKSRLATVLEAEGLLIDPVGAIVAAIALEVIIGRSLDSFASGAVGLIARLVFGGGAGAAIGWLLAMLLRFRRVIPDGLENLVVLGGALTGFALCEAILPESGILAVVIAAAVVGNLEPLRARDVGEFQEQLTLALIGMLFVLLAADVRLSSVVALGSGAIATVAALVVVVRPAGVFWATRGSELSVRERLFVAWLGPRGVVAAAVASVTATALESIDVFGGPDLRALVFLTIALTVVVLGGLAPLVARLLEVRMPGREAIVVLGAEELGIALGTLLDAGEGRVILTDNNAEHCRAASEHGLAVVHGDALAEGTHERLRLERARAVVGMTPNPELNHLFAIEAQDEYGVDEAYAAVGRDRSGVATRLAERHSTRVLFDRPKDVERWNVRLRHGLARQIHLRFGGMTNERPAESITSTPDSYLLLAVRRAGDWMPMCREWVARIGDEAVAFILIGEESGALETLESLGWKSTSQ